MRGTQGVLHNLSLLTVGQVVSQLLNVWALVYLADLLGPHRFGVVQVGVAFMGYVLVLAEGGLFSLGIREVARLDDPPTIFAYARRHLGLLSLQAAVVLGVGLLVLPRLPFGGDPWVFILYLLTVVPQVFMLGWLAVGLERMGWVGAVKSFRSLAYALLVLTLMKPLTGVDGVPAERWVPALFLAAMLAGNVFIGLAARSWFGRWLRPGLIPRGEMKRRWTEALPIGAGILVLRVLLNVDLLVLGAVAAPAVAGQYAAASRVIFLLVVAIEVLWAALLPRFSRLAKQDPAGFRRAFNLYLGFVLAGLLPVAVGGRLLGAELIDLLYGEAYAGAVPVFRNLAVSYTLLAVAMYLGNTLVASDRQRAYFATLLAGAATALAGTLLLAPRHGAEGASWAMLAAHGLLAGLLVLVNRRLFRRSLGALLLLLAPCLAIMVLVVDRAAPWPVVARIVAGAVVYLLPAALALRWFHARNRVVAS